MTACQTLDLGGRTRLSPLNCPPSRKSSLPRPPPGRPRSLEHALCQRGRAVKRRSAQVEACRPGITLRRNFRLSMPAKSGSFPCWLHLRGEERRPPGLTPPTISTPGMIGFPGKWPWKNGSLPLTLLIATMRCPSSISSTRSTEHKRVTVRDDSLNIGRFEHDGKYSGLSAIGCRLSTIGCRLTAIGCRLSAIGCRLTAIGYRLTATAIG